MYNESASVIDMEIGTKNLKRTAKNTSLELLFL